MSRKRDWLKFTIQVILPFASPVLAIIGLIVTLSLAPKEDSGHVTLSPLLGPVPMSTFIRPPFSDSHLRLVFEGKQVAPEFIGMFLYTLTNASQKSISTDDYIRPITAVPENGTKILGVQEYTTNTKYVDDWKQDGDGSFVFRNRVLNPGEVVHYQIWITSKSEIKALDERPFMHFEGKIRDKQFDAFTSVKKYNEAQAAQITLTERSFSPMYSFLYGKSLVAFPILVAVFVLAQLYLMQRPGFARGHRLQNVLWQVLTILLSMSTSETIADALFNGNWNQHIIIYPLLGLHLINLCLILWRSITISNPRRVSSKSMPASNVASQP